MQRLVTVAAVAAILLTLAPAVRAGTYENKEHGFSMKIPGDWSETPTQPGEKIEIAKWKDDRQGAFADLSVRRYVTSDSGEVTPSADGDLPPVPEMPEWGPPRPKSAREALEQAVKRTRALIERNAKFRGIEVDLDETAPELGEPKTLKLGKSEADLYVYEVEAIPKMGFQGDFWVAGVMRRDNEEFLVIGSCAGNRAKRLQGTFLSVIKSFRFLDSEEVAEIEDDDPEGRIIGGKAEDLIDLAKREKIKADLPSSWKYIDTPHYIVIYDCDRPLAAYIAKRIEYMRENAYETVFPPIEPISECMVVRVCKEMDQYHHYGGPPGSAGYWSSGHDELVFPDLSRSKKPDEKTIGVLHHEGFHQYIYYCLLKHDPPVWFNEGCAEYFFCIEGWGKRLKFEKRHPMRYSTLKSAAGTGALIHLKDFVKYSHGQYMAQAQLCYTQGWAFITWCKNVTRNERYAQIPNIYFNELQKGYLEAQGGADAPGGLPAGFMGRNNGVTQKALEKAFEGIDMEELNKAFLNDVKHRM